MRFVQKVKNLADPEMREQNEVLAKELQQREERLKKVKGGAKIKEDASEERILIGWNKCRQRSITYLHYLEQMRPFTENNLAKNLTRSPSSWEKLQRNDYTMKGKKFQSSIRMNKIVNKYKLNKPSNEIADVIDNRAAESLITKVGRPIQANALTNAKSKAAEPAHWSQMSSLDPNLIQGLKNCCFH